MKIRIKIAITIVAFLVGCGEYTDFIDNSKKELKIKAKELSYDLIDKSKPAQDKLFSLILGAFQEKEPSIFDFSTMIENKNWEESKRWIGELNNPDIKLAYNTFNEVLKYEEEYGVIACQEHISNLSSSTSNSVEKKCLRFIGVYMENKGEIKTSEIVASVIIITLIVNGVEPDLIRFVDGGSFQVMEMTVFSVVEYIEKKAGNFDVETLIKHLPKIE